MPTNLTDQEIEVLLRMPKAAGEDFFRRIRTKPKRGHSESELTLKLPTGEEFCVIARRADLNPLDFSIILGFVPPGSTTAFRLRRHNGKSHEHTNLI